MIQVQQFDRLPLGDLMTTCTNLPAICDPEKYIQPIAAWLKQVAGKQLEPTEFATGLYQAFCKSETCFDCLCPKRALEIFMAIVYHCTINLITAMVQTAKTIFIARLASG